MKTRDNLEILPCKDNCGGNKSKNEVPGKQLPYPAHSQQSYFIDCTIQNNTLFVYLLTTNGQTVFTPFDSAFKKYLPGERVFAGNVIVEEVVVLNV